MTDSRYKNMMRKVGDIRGAAMVLSLLDRLITLFVAVSYIGLIILLFMKRSPDLIPAVLVPGLSFGLVSLFRSRFGAKRPYEVYDTPPVLKKDTAGKSFPSRHVFSIFVLGVTFFIQSHVYGVIVLILGLVLGTVRVVGGVHFIKDVVVGGLLGLVSGLLEYLIIFYA